MKKNENSYIFLFIFAFFGLVITLQFRSVMESNKAKPSIAYEIERLNEQLSVEQVKQSKYKEEIDRYIKARDDIVKSYVENKNDRALNRLMNEWEEVKLIAGLSDVMGNGVVIKLNDAQARKSEKVNREIIHDMDIVRIVNELKDAGAQAISVNNERVIPTTQIICTGPTVRINNARHPVPYELKAIGNPRKLYNSLNNSEVVYEMSERDIRIEIKEAKDVVIPKFNENLGNLINALEVVE